MPKKLPKGVSVDRDRHNNVRLYFRARGRAKVRLREEPGTEAFDNEVSCARLGLPYEPEKKADGAAAPRLDRTAAEGSLQWLVQQYKTRGRTRMAPDQLARRARLIEEICDSMHVSRKPGRKSVRRGDLPFAQMERKHILEIRDELRDTAGAQNNLVKYVSAMFGWAVDSGLAKLNPAVAIKDIPTGEGFHTWTREEVLQFEAHHPRGSTARLALHIAMYTGLRRKQVAIFGRQHVRSGWIKIKPEKTAKTSGVTIEIPLLPILDETIRSTSRTGDLTYLVNELGRAFSVAGLGNRMRKWCDDAGLPHCSLHGLRKAGATLAAENGATDDELMAIFGWTTKRQTGLYTKKADRRRLAERAIHKLLPEQKSDRVVPPEEGLSKSGAKMAK